METVIASVFDSNCNSIHPLATVGKSFSPSIVVLFEIPSAFVVRYRSAFEPRYMVLVSTIPITWVGLLRIDPHRFPRSFDRKRPFSDVKKPYRGSANFT